MKRFKVMSIFGTRPEATKMAPLVKAFEKIDWLESIVCVTGQHRQMLDQVLELFDIEPDYDLNIMKHNQTLSDIVSNTLIGLEQVLDENRPDLLLVHGDTSTAFAAAFAAFNKKIKVGHVEAGLRSGDKWSPFPEEMNRALIDTVCDVYFAPTVKNRENLIKENINKDNIYITGNTSIDAIKWITAEPYDFENPLLREVTQGDKRLIVVTAHRRENIGESMYNIFRAIKRIVDEFSDVVVVYPVHLNPKVQALANEVLKNTERIHLIEPLSYKPFANLMKSAHLIMTDSGGIQEEAPALDIPVVVMRTETERPEALEAGTIVLSGVKEEVIYQNVKDILTDDACYQKIAKSHNPYGDGTACQKIIEGIKTYFKL